VKQAEKHGENGVKQAEKHGENGVKQAEKQQRWRQQGQKEAYRK
jgi:hypothetical protein